MTMAANFQSGQHFSVVDPATEQEIASYPLMSPEAVAISVARAKDAYERWSVSALAERKRVMLDAAAILAENAARYADEIAAENGKTRFEALLADIYPTAEFMRYLAKNLKKILKPVRVPGVLGLPFRKAYYYFQPKGVVGVISPWNYPFNLSADPVLEAIAAGNTVVLKPSSQTTRSGLIVKEIFDLAGLPEGVIEVVTGNGSITGQALIENKELAMLYFTGSTAIGREVYRQAAENLIPAVMELGGNDVAIVTRNADLDRAANGIAWSSFTNCGQTCISTEMILVDRTVYETFLEKFRPIIASLKTGKAPGCVGAMTMASQLAVVEEQVADARAKGANVILGGARPDGQGRFYPPTILLDTTPDMKVRKEETFGPVKSVIPFDTIDEAIRMANDSEYGLSGSVWTRDMKEGRMIAARIKTGSVNINDAMMTPAIPSLPFGGVKQSGIGRKHGVEGVHAFCDIKSIIEYGGGIKREIIWYPVPEQADILLEKIMPVLFARSLGRKISAVGGVLRQVYKMFRKR
jgi:acyl-CoA reductase-like NAD-dependent aldehyde dehydrogenase